MDMPETGIRAIPLPGGERIPVLGIGTWNMGEKRQKRADEIAALQMAVDLGMTVVDTAEMYGRRRRRRARRRGARRIAASEIFLVSKVLPQHATRRGTIAVLRGQPSPAEDRPARPVPAALARQRAAGRNARGVRAAASATARFATGASATSTSTTWKSSRRSTMRGRLACRGQPGALQPDAPRHRVRPAAVVPHARHSGDGVLAARTGLARESQDARARSPTRLARDAGASRAGVGAASARCDGDSEGRPRRARAREPRARSTSSSRRRISPSWTTPFRRRRAKDRSK